METTEPAYLVDYSLHLIIIKGNLDRIAEAVKLDGVPTAVRDQVNLLSEGHLRARSRNAGRHRARVMGMSGYRTPRSCMLRDGRRHSVSDLSCTSPNF